MQTYRGALIGCGDVSRHHLAAWAIIEDAEIVAVSNRTVSKAEQRAKEYDIPAVYADYLEMLEME